MVIFSLNVLSRNVPNLPNNNEFLLVVSADITDSIVKVQTKQIHRKKLSKLIDRHTIIDS